MTLRVGIAQIAPVLLHRDATIDKVVQWIHKAAAEKVELLCFGEALVPGYPVWLERTDAARFEAPDQKRLHARYVDQAVDIDAGHLDPVIDAARTCGMTVILGVIERPRDRGGHSVYCCRVFISATGEILSTHRKLMPTYEERLSWAIGDGAGLVTHPAGPFTVGALNCWENWMPLARTALYQQGEDLHVAIWPGGDYNTRDITRFIAREGRSFVISACGLLRGCDIPNDVPERERFVTGPDDVLLCGGSAIAGPDAEWIIEPTVDREVLLTADLDHARVFEERQSFDPVGHYSRPDVLRLDVNHERQR